MSDVSVRLTLQDDVSSKLSRVSSAARTSATQLQQVGQQIDRAFSSNSPEQFASSLGNAMDRAASSMDSLGDSVGQAMEELEQSSAVDFSEGFESAADGADELTRAAEDAGESIGSLSESTKSLGDSVDGLGDGDGLGNLGESADEAGASMGEAEGKANSLADSLKKLFAVVSMAAVLSQVGKYASDAIDIGKDYTAMMSEVQALSGATGSDLALLQNTAREYGATTVFSATEAAEALKYMSLAGWDAQQSSSALGGVLNLAAASGMELGQASDMVTDYLSAFGMQAQDSAYFADMLAYAQANSNTSAAQLGEAYRNSAANLNAAGQDAETVTSMLEAMANQGYKGSEAGTALTAVMRDITNNMEDGAIKIGETSVAVSDAQGNFRDLTDILLDVEKATNGMGEADRAAALGATFTADSTKGLNLMLNEGVENIARYEEALRGSTGAAEDMADTMNDNLNGDMANMNSAFEEMELQTFEAMEEPMRDGVQYLTNTIIPILTEWVPTAFESFASGANKLGNALKPLFETILKNPQAITGALTSLGAGFLAMKTVSTGSLYEEIMGSDQAAMQDIYKAMKPDVDSMTGLIDEYREMGQAIPQDVMQAFNDAMMVGAAAGDADAAWQVFASQMVADPANAALVQAIQEGTINVPDELRTAIERATAETTIDPVTIEGMQADVEDVEVNEAHVQELIDTAFEGLTYVGTTTLDGGEIALQYTVNEGETLSGIMEQYGVVWSEVEQQIREANPEIKDLNLIYPDQVINIPEAIVEAASVDASQVGEAAKEAAENETGQTIEEEQSVKTTLKNEGVESSEVGQAAEAAAKNETGEVLEREQPVKTNMTNAGVDDSQVAQAAQEQETQAEPKETQVPTTIKFEVASLDDSALASAISEKLQQGEAVPVTVPANVTIQAGTIDDGALSSEIGSKLGEQNPVPVTVPADITMTAGSINSSPAVEAAQTDITSAFATALPADGTVDVTLAKGADNIAALYAEVGGLVRSAWASPYSASGVVNVTLTANYSLANPTKTISFGGGATGSATVSASLHALGGIFDEPHLGIVAEAGPESIIPLDGSDRSLSLFEQTGEMLGVLNSGEGKSVEAPAQTVNAPQSVSQPVGSPQTSERVIRLEIGGQGSINVSGSGVSKEKIVDAMMENLRDVFMNIVQQEIIEEGEGAYEF